MCSISENYNVFEVSFMTSFETKAVKFLASSMVQISVTSILHPVLTMFIAFECIVSILYLQIIVFVCEKFIVHNPYIQINC